MDVNQQVDKNRTKGFAGPEKTGVEDRHYDLISVLYHALQSAETCERYIQDAHADQDILDFFRECQRIDVERADRAQELLRNKLVSSQAGQNQSEGRFNA
jgi:hypothetical protein